MVLFNYSTKELTAKVVYYGPGLCGKTTNLQWIHEKVPIKNKGKMLSLATETDRTLFFDFLPIEIGTIRGMKTRIQLYTVPGQVFYNATRRMVLKGADCVVFVCDTQEPMIEACLESFENLRQNLEANEIDPDEIPMVLQYNKRDLPNALPIEILNERINPKNYPFYEAVATKGIGVEETLKGVTKLVFKSLSTRYGTGDAPVVAPSAPAPAPRPPAAAPPRPAPPKPPARTATIPPAAGRPPMSSAEDLMDLVAEEVAPRRRRDTAEIPLIVEEDEVTEPPVSRIDTQPKGSTLISTPDEAEDLRRRITMPSVDFDVNLEAIEEEEDEIEEISLDSEPLPPVRRPVPPQPAPPRAPAPVAPQPVAPLPAAPQRVAPLPATPRAAAPHPAAPHPAIPAPIDVEISGNSGHAEVSVPIELNLDSDTTQVNLSLRLVLKIKRPR
jgi:signal recognition particle receptor subunit beta